MRIDSDHPFFTRINIKLARIELELQRAEMAAAAWRGHEGPIREISEIALAACLHHAYNGIESILEDVAKEFDGSVPSGGHQHRDLLDAMAAPGQGRPELFDQAGHEVAIGLLRLRQFFNGFHGNPIAGNELCVKFDRVNGTLIPVFTGQLSKLEPSSEAGA